MFSYASRRITRGRSLFLALFLSVVLAATLFSGILQGADAVGGSTLTKTLSAMRYDIVAVNPYDKDVAVTHLYAIDGYFGATQGVEHVDHFLRLEVEFNSTYLNGTFPTLLVSVPSNSSLGGQVNVDGGFQDGKVYVDLGSMNTTKLTPGSKVNLGVLTYRPGGDLADFHRLYYPIDVGQPATTDDQTWCLFNSAGSDFTTSDGKSMYNTWASAALSGNEATGRGSYNLVIVTENTFKGMLNDIYAQGRAPTLINSVAAIRLDRSIINQWDIPGSQVKLDQIDNLINGQAGAYGYIPEFYLAKVLGYISSNSATVKLNTIVVTTPVFFTAWYLGMTVSDVTVGLRRREIGLLLTRGMSHRQVFSTLLYESLLIGIVSGVLGVVLGAIVLPLAISGANIATLFRYVSPVTFAATVGFSLVLAILAAYNPARKATQMEIVEALREYRAEEETLGGWTEPLIAVSLGLYKLVFLLLRLNIEDFRPASGDFISFLAYNTWYGMNYLLDFVWTILLFWGFTKLLLMYAPQFQTLLGNLASRIVGDAARFTSLSSKRSLKRAGAYTFMVALIVSYSVVVVGNAAITNDYMGRFISDQMGADASVMIYRWKAAPDIAAKIAALPGVESASVEVTFGAAASGSTLPVRAIDVSTWDSTFYMDVLAIDPSSYAKLAAPDAIVKDQYGVIKGASALMERGMAKYYGIEESGGNINIKVDTKVYNLKIVGLFGRDMGDNWTPQNPTIILPAGMIAGFDESWLSGTRVIVKLAPSTDTAAFTTGVKALGPNVQNVEVTSDVVTRYQSSSLIAGSKQVIQLGIVFAAAVASVGVALVVYTLLRGRMKELNLMSVRGYSTRQLAGSLITENVGLAALATVLGVTIGLVNLSGQVATFNRVVVSYTSWRLVFPSLSVAQVALLFLVIVVATAIPVVMIVRRITEEPNVKVD